MQTCNNRADLIGFARRQIGQRNAKVWQAFDEFRVAPRREQSIDCCNQSWFAPGELAASLEQSCEKGDLLLRFAQSGIEEAIEQTDQARAIEAPAAKQQACGATGDRRIATGLLREGFES